MEDVFELLNSYFKIIQIIIENFTIIDETLEICIKVTSKSCGDKTIIFEEVSGINIMSAYYFCSNKSSIIIEDLSSVQLEGVKYKVAISEDAMSFYCSNIKLKK